MIGVPKIEPGADEVRSDATTRSILRVYATLLCTSGCFYAGRRASNPLRSNGVEMRSSRHDVVVP